MKRKPPLLTLALIVLTILLSIASGPLVSAVELPAPLRPYAFPLLLGVTLLLILIAIAQFFMQKTEQQPGNQLPTGQYRERMLESVRSTWITGLLEQSLHGAALIALGFKKQPDMVANPWRLVVQELDHSERPLSPGTDIIQVFDEAGGELLILGEPGAGKTTLLLELTRDLLDRAKQNETYPIPAVFNLSSWASKRLPLTDWLLEELNTRYRVPPESGQTWIDKDQMLPLLDGLDEMAPANRIACIHAINIYRQKHGLVPLVVCSRSSDYLAQTNRVQLRCAVVIQPLTAQQIDAYLSSAGELEAIRVTLRDDPTLQRLITTPLMLSVLMLAYHGLSVENLPRAESPLTAQKQLFATYVKRMLERRGTPVRYTSDQTVRWLTWLAWQLALRSQTEFSPERLQSNWLSGYPSRRSYRAAVIGSATGLIFGSLVGVIVGVATGVFVGLGGGIAAALLGWLYGRWLGKQVGELSGGRNLGSGLLDKLDSGLDSEMIINLHSEPDSNLVRGLYSKLASGLASGLFIGLLFGLIGGGPVGGLVVGLLYVLIYFGIVCTQHFVLRFLLWRNGSIPWNYPSFLDYAVDRIILRKVGESYIFAHQLLRDYFAGLHVISSAEVTRAQGPSSAS